LQVYLLVAAVAVNTIHPLRSKVDQTVEVVHLDMQVLSKELVESTMQVKVVVDIMEVVMVGLLLLLEMYTVEVAVVPLIQPCSRV
jgi:hypothetical protein